MQLSVFLRYADVEVELKKTAIGLEKRAWRKLRISAGMTAVNG
jgi:hypothetical protein